ncbi:hypothetical protein DFH08DRAFT_809933 [Mycena albidolilacea]|uniref:Uncharacterized protein n=1 Tax=Mycena albidolilacea TaxID=1033008 RepID=A0AAD7EPD9_9AGAR|nr:hypothetical protein DFH08DRAFT_809933 [Mycena albidolilacea]
MSFLLHCTSKHSSYILQSKLCGHSGGIVQPCAMEDRRLLASGGTDSTKVWDLSTMQELGSPKSPKTHAASTALIWIKHENDLGKALFYGTQNGQLVYWREGKQDACTIIQRFVLVLIQCTQGLMVFEEISCVCIVNPAEITGLAFDPPSNRLAFCHRGSMVQIYTLSATMSLKEIFSLELQNVAPRAIAFGRMYFNDRDIMIFGLYGGDMGIFVAKNLTVDSPVQSYTF